MASSVYGVGHHSFACVESGSSSFIFGVEKSQVNCPPAFGDPSAPLPIALQPVNASVLGDTREDGQVLAVLTVRNDAEIVPAIVQFVSVDVVAFSVIACRKPEQISMHADMPTAFGQVAHRIPVRVGVPAELADMFDVGSINDSVATDDTLLACQRDHVGTRIVRRRDYRQRPVDTGWGAELAIAAFDLAFFSQETEATPLADAENGTLVGHHVPPVNGGARPVTAPTVRGPLVFNCTRWGVI